MPCVQIILVLLSVNVIMDFLEMELAVLVCKPTSLACQSTLFSILILCLFVDINECLNSPCGRNASCIDNEGSFICQCNVGFSGDGFTCTGWKN